MEIKELIEQRKAKLSALEAKGITIYNAPPSGSIAIGEVLNNFQEGKGEIGDASIF